MKLSRSLIAFATASANTYEKCEQLDTTKIANISPNGLKCVDATCTLKCEDGYSAMSPNKMKCIKEDGEWTILNGSGIRKNSVGVQHARTFPVLKMRTCKLIVKLMLVSDIFPLIFLKIVYVSQM